MTDTHRLTTPVVTPAAAASRSGVPRGPGAHPGTTRALRTQRVTPLRHPVRWVVTAIVLVLVPQIVHGFVTNPRRRTGLCWPRLRGCCRPRCCGRGS
jgi:hypothetical protein